MSSRVKRCLRDIEVTCESRGHTKARDHPENKEVSLEITKVIGVSGFIRGLSGVNQETRRGDTSDFEDQRPRGQRASRGQPEVTESIQSQAKQRSAFIQRPGPCLWNPSGKSPESLIPRDQASRWDWVNRNICGGVWLGLGSSREVWGPEDSNGTRVDGTAQSEKTFLGTGWGRLGEGGQGHQEATMVVEALDLPSPACLLWAGQGHGVRPSVPSPPPPWPSWETHGDLFPPPPAPPPTRLTDDRK